MTRKQKGTALNQYAMIIGLVILAIIPIYVSFGDQTVKALSDYANQYINMNNQINSNINTVASNTSVNNDTNTPTTTTNTPTTTVSNTSSSNGDCLNNSCTIDFGDIKLTGVPQNLNDIIETAGVSGGMDKLIDVLYQIAAQYEAQGKTQQALNIKILATTGHNMALVQKDFENFVFNTCKGDAKCFSSYQNKTYPMPAGYDSTYYKFPTTSTYMDAPYLTNLGAGLASPNDTNTGIATFYQNTLKKIKSDSAISDSVKGIVNELSWDIGTVSQKWLNPFVYLIAPQSSTGNQGFYNVDPLTGSLTKVYYDSSITAAVAYSQIQKINAPELTDVDAGLICASGSYTDTGTSCH